MLKRGPRMFVRVYLALLGSLVAATTLFALAHIFFMPNDAGRMELIGQVAVQALAPPNAPADEQAASLLRWHGRGLTGPDAMAPEEPKGAVPGVKGPVDWRLRPRRDLALYDADKHLIAFIGRPLPRLTSLQDYSGPMFNAPKIFAIHLSDGRWLLVRRGALPHQVSVAILVLLSLIAVVVAVGAYPVVRRITGRLERLQRQMQAWGSGDLSARVQVEGRDEVAGVAVSFNEAAARIEALMAAQKSLLANASHELRSPLARIRMAVELMEGQAAPALRAELARNIGELDQLIDEVLLASRLDALPPAAEEELDLAAVVAEECARTDATPALVPATVRGDARLLRRLVRNLLENAVRYGGSGVQVELAHEHCPQGQLVRLDVCDRGPGVPEDQRERIFEPFYRLPGASEAAGGVGLGLALVRQIAQRHHGSVQCLERAGGGSCFRVLLPAP